MERKTSELTGTALRWAVAKCENRLGDSVRPDRKGILRDQTGKPDPYTDELPEYEPDADWSQGGPIIERERITLECTSDAGWYTAEFRSNDKNRFPAYGPSPLIAAMRCFVESRLGDTVTIPDELC